MLPASSRHGQIRWPAPASRSSTRLSARLLLCSCLHNVAVIGSGAREHSVAWKLAQSDKTEAIYCLPGNAGTAREHKCSNVPGIAASDHAKVLAWCKKQSIDLVVIGPEAPLVAGLSDDLRAGGMRVFGPSKDAALLEGSKIFMKEFCERHSIPTAAHAVFHAAADAKAYLQQQQAYPVVIKADGLAGGKGVIIAEDVETACRTVDSMISDAQFGEAGSRIVIEEFLRGEEASFFALVDGETCVGLLSSQDHKAVGEGDTGPNTGGMGAYSPAPIVTPNMAAQIMETIVQPTARGMAADGRPFSGVLFCGVMIRDGKALLLEFNVRFGDPECQGLMMQLETDLLDVVMAASEGRLQTVPLKWSSESHALTVVIAAKGYPGQSGKGHQIDGLDQQLPAKLFHGSTYIGEDGTVKSGGGRVMCVTATGSSLQEAQQKAYQAVNKINWSGGFVRRDIAWRALSKSS